MMPCCGGSTTANAYLLTFSQNVILKRVHHSGGFFHGFEASATAANMFPSLLT